MPLAVLPLTKLRYLGSTWLPVIAEAATVPNTRGDLRFGTGMALRQDPTDGSWRIFRASWNPQVILEFKLPVALYGSGASYVRNLGALPRSANGVIGGLYWDEATQRLYQSHNEVYEGPPIVAHHTASRGYIDSVSGQLVTEARLLFTGRSSKMTQSGILPLPSAWAASYTPGKRLATGFGGYQSVVSAGPASMGLALTAFDPPAGASDTAISVANTPLVGYPYGTSITGTPRAQRPTNYTQEFHDNFPIDPTIDGIGYFTWAERIYQGAAWIQTANYQGVLVAHTMGVSRCWYGSNDPAHPDGVPAAINSTHRQHAWAVYDPDDLGQVALGNANQASIQPSVPYEFLQFEGLPAQLNGDPNTNQSITGMVYEPTINKLFVCVSFAKDYGLTTSRDKIYVFEVDDTVDPPTPPVPDPLVITTTAPLPSGDVGLAYSKTLAATGGVPPYQWSATGLPAGLACSLAGVIAGVPLIDGSFSSHLAVTDTQPAQTTAIAGLTVIPAPAPDPPPPPPPDPPPTPPENDLFDAAILLTGASGSRNGTTKNARLQLDAPAPTVPAVWYKYISTSKKRVTFTVDSSAVVVEAFSGTVLATLVKLGQSAGGRLVVSMAAGVTYYLRVRNA